MIFSIYHFPTITSIGALLGVRMHIPDVERAISELAPVTKPGGFLVLEEINQSAPEAG